MIFPGYTNMIDRYISLKNFLLTGVAVLLLTGCMKRSAVVHSDTQLDSLREVIATRDLALDDLTMSFSQIEKNLHAVAAKQHMIAKNTANETKFISIKDKINREIAVINNLMEENRKMITNLNNRYGISIKQHAQLGDLIRTLNDQIARKDQELATLNEKLSTLHTHVTELQTSVDTLTQTVTEQTKASHSAFYVVGKTKDLENAKIIDRTGGLLGIGRTSKLSADFDESQFTQVDFTQMGAIPVDSRNVKIITSHPSDSYSLTKDKKDVVKCIVITDPEKFWANSKYLVVVKE